MKDESTATTSTKFERNLNHEHNTAQQTQHKHNNLSHSRRKKEKANSVSKLRRNVSVKNEFNIFFYS